MQREECIYNLIPRIVVQPVKPDRYRSKHDPSVAPTGSTFGFQGKTRLIGSNVGENTHVDRKAGAKGIGKISVKPDPKGYIKKGERCSTIVDPTKKPTKYDYSGPRKPSIVTREEKPIMGLKAAKNFVTANAVEAILAVPGNRARVTNEPPQYLKKEDFGHVPRYLNQVKDEIERENELIEEFVRQNRNILDEDDSARIEPLDDRERKQLVDALKAKWGHVNSKYQKLCHNVVFDTLGKVRRKETFEKELTQLEKDIELLSKGQVAVAKTNDYHH